MSEVPSDIQKLSFEKALAELEEIVDNLESGSTDLEKSINFILEVPISRRIASKN